MRLKKLEKQINRKKRLLNFLLLFFLPSNPLIVLLSQNLDKHLYEYQYYLL